MAYKHRSTPNSSMQNFRADVEKLGVDRCLYAIDTPYEIVKEAQDWWKTVDLPEKEKEAVARSNAVKLFKLPLDID